MVTDKNNSNIIVCSDDESEVINIKQGNFKRVKNLDPSNSGLEIIFDHYDKVNLHAEKGSKALSFYDKDNNLVYAFVTDKDEKITSGVIISYNHYKEMDFAGIYKTDKTGNFSLMDSMPDRFSGTEKEKEKIKDFIENKINGVGFGLQFSLQPMAKNKINFPVIPDFSDKHIFERALNQKTAPFFGQEKTAIIDDYGLKGDAKILLEAYREFEKGGVTRSELESVDSVLKKCSLQFVKDGGAIITDEKGKQTRIK